MLKQIQILLLLLSLMLNLEAQDPFESSTHIGFNGGTNFSRVSFTPSVKQNLLTSSSFGLVLRHISEPHIGLQVEVNYAGKGWIENLDSVGTYTRKLTTIDVPMMAVFIAGSKTVRFAFTLGPYVSYRRQEKETIKLADPQYYKQYYEKPLVNNWEFGFTGGLAIELHTKIGAFGIRACYSHSLSNLFPLNIKSKIGVLPENADQLIDTPYVSTLSEYKYYFSASRSQVIHAGITYFIKL